MTKFDHWIVQLKKEAKKRDIPLSIDNKEVWRPFFNDGMGPYTALREALNEQENG